MEEKELVNYFVSDVSYQNYVSRCFDLLFLFCKRSSGLSTPAEKLIALPFAR